MFVFLFLCILFHVLSCGNYGRGGTGKTGRTGAEAFPLGIRIAWLCSSGSRWRWGSCATVLPEINVVFLMDGGYRIPRPLPIWL
jgi:hypothetical protein